MLPSAAMVGAKVMLQWLTASGSRNGVPQPSSLRLTRQRFMPFPGRTLLPLTASIGFPSVCAGRFDTNTRNEPSGDIAGSRSRHLPENDGVTGLDQCLFTRRDFRMVK